jgi:hypothetical protein
MACESRKDGSNKSFDWSGGSVKSLPIVDLIRAAASTLTFGA